VKLLAACLLAIALVFRAAPLCASPVATEAVAAMPGCDDMTGHHDEERGQSEQDAARAYHACAFPPVTSAAFNHSMPPADVPSSEAVAGFSGRMAEPPTPPPRDMARTNFQQFNGVKS
jgi:hypothetical protein